MKIKTGWEFWVFCKCGFRETCEPDGIGRRYYVGHSPCPSCGEVGKFKQCVARVASLAVWWNPFTWANCELEIKENRDAEF